MKLSDNQIRYFERRLEFISKQYRDKIREKFPEKRMTNEQKIKEILNGTAKINTDVFGGGSCPSGQLFSFFTFSDNGGIEEYNKVREIVISDLYDTLSTKARDFTDSWVYGLEKEPNIIDKFTSFCEDQYKKYAARLGANLSIKKKKGRKQ